MRVLALDTSAELGSVALVADDRPLAELALRVRARHGEVLLPHVARVLDAAGLARGDVDLFAVGLGPGSFTGARIAVATAKGLAFALDRPLVGVSSLRALARAAPTAEVVAPVVEAYRGEVYAALFAPGAAGALEERLAPTHGPPDAVARALRGAAGPGRVVTLVGDGLPRHRDALRDGLGGPLRALGPEHAAPRAVHVAIEARRVFEARGADDLDALEPAYLRDADAKVPGDPRSPHGGGQAS